MFPHFCCILYADLKMNENGSSAPPLTMIKEANKVLGGSWYHLHTIIHSFPLTLHQSLHNISMLDGFQEHSRLSPVNGFIKSTKWKTDTNGMHYSSVEYAFYPKFLHLYWPRCSFTADKMNDRNTIILITVINFVVHKANKQRWYYNAYTFFKCSGYFTSQNI